MEMGYLSNEAEDKLLATSACQKNIVQGIARDLLCYSMNTLSHCFIVATVHDEMIIECSPDVSLDVICEQMARTPAWAACLLLRADGYECEFYKKD